MTLSDLFVIGPVGTGGGGLVRRCVECRERSHPGTRACPGFDAGCLVSREIASARAPLEEREPDSP